MIYYVEDDPNIRDLAVYALCQAGLEAKGFPHAEAFFEGCRENPPEVVLLDIMLPGVDGLEILATLRDDPSLKDVPVMMLTAKGSEFDKVIGLDAGADDYLAKPFGMMELVSRVNALLRRARRGEPAASRDKSGEGVVSAGPLALDVAAHAVTAGGRPVTLTLKEFDLLRVLMENEGHVLSRAQLLEQVWDVTYAGETRTVDVHVQTLRQKLAHVLEGADALIVTVRGVGYCFRLDGPASQAQPSSRPSSSSQAQARVSSASSQSPSSSDAPSS